MVLLLGKALTLKCHHIGRGPSLEDSLPPSPSSQSLYSHIQHMYYVDLVYCCLGHNCGIYMYMYMYVCMCSLELGETPLLMQVGSEQLKNIYIIYSQIFYLWHTVYAL